MHDLQQWQDERARRSLMRHYRKGYLTASEFCERALSLGISYSAAERRLLAQPSRFALALPRGQTAWEQGRQRRSESCTANQNLRPPRLLRPPKQPALLDHVSSSGLHAPWPGTGLHDDLVPYMPPAPPPPVPWRAADHTIGCRWRCPSCGFHNQLPPSCSQANMQNEEQEHCCLVCRGACAGAGALLVCLCAGVPCFLTIDGMRAPPPPLGPDERAEEWRVRSNVTSQTAACDVLPSYQKS